MRLFNFLVIKRLFVLCQLEKKVCFR